MKKAIHIKELIDKASVVIDDVENGLSHKEVLLRVGEGLTNKTKRHVTKTYAEIIFSNLISFFNLVLITIGIFMFIAQQYSGLFFLIILFTNIAIGLFQDIRARRLVDRLSLITDPKARVVRERKIYEINVEDLVLSDIIILKAGDQISIDAAVVDGLISVNESLLTGESAPVDKSLGAKVFSGSFVTSGTARVRATSVGRANYAEQLQTQAKLFRRPKSEILKSIRLMFLYIGAIVILFAVAYIITFSLKGNFSTSQGFKTAVGTIAGSLVAMIPSGMYLLTSMTLAVGVIRLANRRMLVQELYSIENLARVDVLCLDKTGTLTDGEMDVKRIIPFNGASIAEVHQYIAALVNSTKDDNKTARALLKVVGEVKSLAVIGHIPFSSDRKYAAVSIKNHGTIFVGACEFINPCHDAKVEEIIENNAKAGYRVLIMAKNIENNDGELMRDLKTIAIIILQDHIRDDAKSNIEWFKNNGVNIKIISGDNIFTVAEVGRQVGVEGADKYISLENIPLDEVPQLALNYNIFGRVNPEQKEVLIRALRDAGSTVAMTGDGVNDILALKVADCSIAMASGAAAARNVAHLVALDSDFGQLPKVVEEGRRVINNLQRISSLFLAKTIFAIITSFVFLVSGWFGGQSYPFLTNNLYIWEICTIGIASFFLALQKNNEQLKGTFMKNILFFALPGGIMQSLLVFVIYALAFSFPSVINMEAAKAMSILAFTASSYFILVKISWPLDSYRLLLLLSMIALGLFAFIFDYFFKSWRILEIAYQNLQAYHALILFVLLALALLLYLLISKLTERLINNKIKV